LTLGGNAVRFLQLSVTDRAGKVSLLTEIEVYGTPELTCEKTRNGGCGNGPENSLGDIFADKQYSPEDCYLKCYGKTGCAGFFISNSKGCLLFRDGCTNDNNGNYKYYAMDDCIEAPYKSCSNSNLARVGKTTPGTINSHVTVTSNTDVESGDQLEWVIDGRFGDSDYGETNYGIKLPKPSWTNTWESWVSIDLGKRSFVRYVKWYSYTTKSDPKLKRPGSFNSDDGGVTIHLSDYQAPQGGSGFNTKFLKKQCGDALVHNQGVQVRTCGRFGKVVYVIGEPGKVLRLNELEVFGCHAEEPAPQLKTDGYTFKFTFDFKVFDFNKIASNGGTRLVWSTNSAFHNAIYPHGVGVYIQTRENVGSYGRGHTPAHGAELGSHSNGIMPFTTATGEWHTLTVKKTASELCLILQKGGKDTAGNKACATRENSVTEA
jgi:hypothetical protein